MKKLIDTKKTEKASRLALAVAVLTPYATTSPYARRLLHSLQSSRKLTPSQWKQVLGQENTFESRYREQFGEPDIQEYAKEVELVLTPPKPAAVSSVQEEDLSEIRAYETETTPTRRALAWAKEHGLSLIRANEVSPYFSFPYLNPIQTEAYRYRDLDVNLVVSALTSGGKTEVALIFALEELKRGRKVLYLSPLKALSQEKYETWTKPGGIFEHYTVTIHTGDYTLTESRKKTLETSDVIIFTAEMLESRSRWAYGRPDNFLRAIGLLICDESHLLGMRKRGAKFESALMRFTEINPDARILFLSATFPNIEEVSSWVSSLNKKQTISLISEFRPTRVQLHVEPYYAQAQNFFSDVSARASKCFNLVSRYPDDHFLIFCPTKYALQQILKRFKDAGIPCAEHSASLSKDRRKATEEAFRSGNLRVLVATSTLSFGINLPARRVIVAGVSRGDEDMTSSEILQMLGRAGRAGLDPEGDAYVLVPSTMPVEVRDQLLVPERINSELSYTESLAFQIVAEIKNGRSTYSSLQAWIQRGFFAWQTHSSNDVLDQLIRATVQDLIDKDCVAEKNGELNVTPLGRLAATYYYSPYDCFAWKNNLLEVSGLGHDLDDWGCAWVVGNAPSYAAAYIPQALSKESFPSRGWSIAYQSYPTIAALYLVLQGKKERLAPLGLLSQWLDLAGDLDRMREVFSRIQSDCLHLKAVDLDILFLRLKKGLPLHLVGLGRIPGVGYEAARGLYGQGIRTPSELLQHTDLLADSVGWRAGRIIEAARVLVSQGGHSGYAVEPVLDE